MSSGPAARTSPRRFRASILPATLESARQLEGALRRLRGSIHPAREAVSLPEPDEGRRFDRPVLLRNGQPASAPVPITAGTAGAILSRIRRPGSPTSRSIRNLGGSGGLLVGASVQARLRSGGGRSLMSHWKAGVAWTLLGTILIGLLWAIS
jgi:hypothetical protein